MKDCPKNLGRFKGVADLVIVVDAMKENKSNVLAGAISVKEEKVSGRPILGLIVRK